MNGQTTIFDMLYPKYKITKPIRLIEFFAGYGSQALALKYLGVKFEHWKICEWAVKSIKAYKDIHFTDDNIDYSKGLSKEQLIEYLNNKEISSNYNEPMFKAQIQRLNENTLRGIYNDIQATHNLVNIQQVKGKDLEIVDTDKYDYILTYSFPCQDLSLAGKGKGMSDTSTRSGMLWEVERILSECKELDSLPQILLMENVPQVHGADNVEDFNKWQLKLEELGYKNYFEDLIATDYGIPQTRNRCFMVSILGDYNYTFPKPIPLKLKLKYMLEDNVDEKYYLSDKMINCFLSESKDSKFPRKERFLQTFNTTNEKGIAATITTCAGTRATDNFIANKSLRETLEQNDIQDTCYIDAYNRKIDEEKSGTITTRVSASNNTFLAIKNATKKGYLEATDGDGIDLAQPNSETRRGRVQKDSIQTLTTQNNLGVCVNDKPQVLGGIGEKDSNNNTQWKQQNRIYDNNVGIAITTCFNPNYIDNNLRIRKLTPKECFRLMGVKDEDFEKCAKNQSDSSLYHLAGDSIVVNVLMAIFKELL